LALLGVAFYVLLLPWHLTSQFSAQLYRADAGMFADSMCSPDGSNPALPASNCPICKGLAAFQLALATPATALLPAMPHASPVLTIVQDDVGSVAVPHPRSRGPPRLYA
jgi:hypothetical protein